MPYTLFQGGRRRRKRRGPAIAAVLAMVAGFLGVVLLLGQDQSRSPHATATPTPTPGTRLPLQDSGTAPLAGGGTAPSPLAVRLDDPRDAVRIHFNKAPRSALLFDLDTGRVLWRRDPTRVLPIASLTKMMTAIIVADRVSRGHKVLVTKEAVHYKGSAVGLLPKGKWIGVETMLHGLLLPSGNDAAIALAQRTAKTVPRFVKLMNARAKDMGLVCTRFSSPDGFEDRGNHSCAADLAAIARQLLRTPRLARIVKRRSASLPFPIKGGHIYLYNNNPLLRSGYPGTTGVKTGYTDAAGRCLVASARRGQVRLGIVLLDSPDPGKQARQLLDRGFRALRS
jgi:D-alanyl-D-alanine carboxypeptidase (penicillin-binding protein 5/6)